MLKFDQRKAELAALAESSKRITEIRDQVSRDECHGARMQLKTARVAIEKIGKAAREDAQAFSKAVIAKEKELIGVISPEEERLQALQSEWDDARQAEKDAIREAEEARIRAENAALEAIRNLPAEMVGRGAEDIAHAANELLARDLAAEFHQNVLAHAEEVRRTAIAKLETLIATARELERERAESAKLRAEAAEREAAQRKAEAERQEREAAERRQREEAEAAAALEREHIEDIRRIPLTCIGYSVVRLDLEIEDAKAIDPSPVIKDPDRLAQALEAKAAVVAQLQQMRATQQQAEEARAAALERDRAAAEESRKAEEDARRWAQEARLAELKASAPPLPAAALDALALLAGLGQADSDVAIRLRFAIERDRDVVQRLIDAYDAGAEASSRVGGWLPEENAIDFAREYVAGADTPTA